MTPTETVLPPRATSAAAPAAARPGLGSALAFALGVAALVLATWLYQGYRYEVWPQPGFLSFVLNFSGELENDWYTGLPAGHWAIDHLLAVVPSAKLDEAVLGLWLVFLVVLWSSFVSICRSLGAPVYAAVAGGLVLILTKIGGMGASETLFEFFYPNTLSFAIAVGSIALVLRRQYLLAGAALGLSVMVHPGLGPLAVAAVAPAALFAEGRPTRAHVLRFGIPLVAVAAVPMFQLLGDLLSGGTLTPQERFDFVTIVRVPHHILYSAFTAIEYTRTLLWGAALVLALIMLRWLPEVRPVRWIALTIAIVCALGAIASVIGWPLMLVTAQTSRLTALAVLLAVATAVAALSRVDARLATVVFVGAFLLAGLLEDKLFLEAGRLVEYMSISAVAAGLVLAALVGARLLGRRATPRLSGALPTALAAVALAGAGLSLLVEREAREPQEAPLAVAFKDVARQAEFASPRGTVVLTPPDQDGFSMLSRRPTVVEFGSIRLGKGEDEWRRRILDVTHEPAVLDPDSVGTDVVARVQIMADAYDRTIGSTPDPICRYGAQLVVTRAAAGVPDWLVPVYSNDGFTLNRVDAGTCD